MRCPECDAELHVAGHESGDIIVCAECGCEMELISKDPFEIRVIEEEK
jgi:alpha-aminoadipate carrier protein LysW